jgi:hypothetical protein
MADDSKITATSVDVTSHVGPPRPDPAPVAAELPLFRFRLRQLFVFVAALSTLLAAVVSSQGLIALALLLAVSVVAAHVFSTVLGTRLRGQADRAQALNQQNFPSFRVNDGRLGRPGGVVDLPPVRRSPWHRRGSTLLPWLPRLVITGIVLGGVGGAMTLAAAIGHRTRPAGILVGSFSLAVLGGWVAFLGGSFYGIFRAGLQEALADQQEDEINRARI